MVETEPLIRRRYGNCIEGVWVSETSSLDDEFNERLHLDLAALVERAAALWLTQINLRSPALMPFGLLDLIYHSTNDGSEFIRVPGFGEDNQICQWALEMVPLGGASKCATG